LYRSEEKEEEVEDYGWQEEEGCGWKEQACNSAVFRTVLEPEEAE
jgi:hypothetical protein